MKPHCASSLVGCQFLFGIVLLSSAVAGRENEFYTQKGSDPSFAEVMESGDLPRGKNSGDGFQGSSIKINHDLLKDEPNAGRPLIRDIMIHTLGNSMIRRKDFPKWSRWYQEDENTQIFRLFKGEENVRNSRELAARVEAFSAFKWKEGDGWQEWVATYTIIKPHRCAIFQAKNPINDWSVMINMNDNGDVSLNHRRGEDKLLAKSMTGKPFHLRVRENGRDYEVYFNGKKEGEGTYPRPKGETGFRWGMYLGAKPVEHDAMILVTGAAVNPRKLEGTVAEESSKREETIPTVSSEPGIPIPPRVWTNREGVPIKAEARYELGSDSIRLKVRDNWVSYPIADLSDSDRSELAKAVEALTD